MSWKDILKEDYPVPQDEATQTAMRNMITELVNAYKEFKESFESMRRGKHDVNQHLQTCKRFQAALNEYIDIQERYIV